MPNRPTSGPPAAVPQFTVRHSGRPRVLVEDTELGPRRELERRLRKEGYDVVGCCGPETLSRQRCPIEELGPCPAVSEADVVVTVLRDDTDRLPQVLAGIRAQHPEVPVVVRAPGPIAHSQRHRLQGCEVQSLTDDPVAPVAAALEAGATA